MPLRYAAELPGRFTRDINLRILTRFTALHITHAIRHYAAHRKTLKPYDIFRLEVRWLINIIAISIYLLPLI